MLMKLLGIGMMFMYNCFFISYCSKILKPRVPKVLLYTLIPAIASAVFSFQTQVGVLIPIVYMVNFLMYFIILKVAFEGKISYIFWAAENVIFHILVIRALTVGIISLVVNKNMFRVIEDNEMYFFSLAVSLIVMTAFLYLFNLKVDVHKIKLLLGNTGQLRFVYTTQAVMLAFLFFCTYAYYYNLDLIWFTIFHIITAFFVILCFYVILNMSVKTSVWIDSRFYGEQVNKRMNKHLRRHHEYLLMAEAAGKPIKKYSDIPVADCILKELANDCEDKEVTLNAQCFFSSTPILSNLQLYTVLEQLCSNALEACERQTRNSHKWIEISTAITDEKLTILVKNSFNGVITMSENELKSTKKNRDYYGLGIWEIKRVVSEAGGSCDIVIRKEQKEFQFSVILPIGEIVVAKDTAAGGVAL